MPKSSRGRNAVQGQNEGFWQVFPSNRSVSGKILEMAVREVRKRDFDAFSIEKFWARLAGNDATDRTHRYTREMGVLGEGVKPILGDGA
jgi:hypothetical protein